MINLVDLNRKIEELKTIKKDKLILLILAGILLVVIKLPAKNTVKTKKRIEKFLNEVR